MGSEVRAQGQCPDFVAIGFACRDLVDQTYVLGGGVVYASLAACNLGLSVGIVTSLGPDLDLAAVLPGIEIVARPSPASTVFRNVYVDKARTQYLYSRAGTLSADDVPPGWREASVVLLSPLAQEVPYNLGQLFPHALVGANVQGWLRIWDETRRVWPLPWPAGPGAMVGAQVLIAGESDLAAEPRGVAALVESLPKRPGLDPPSKGACDLPSGEHAPGPGGVVVLTQGERGCTVYWEGRSRSFPAYPAVEVDPTGAGDTFAAAFLIEFRRSGDLAQAADFANCVASFVVERPGVEGVPTLVQVESRLGRAVSPWRSQGFGEHRT